LKKVFAGIGEKETAALEKIFEEITFQKNEVIVKEDEPGEELFIVKEGHALVKKRGEISAELKPGDIIGEMSLIESSRSATVTAVEKTVLYKSDTKDFYKLFAKYPNIAVSLFQILSNRLRNINDKVVEKALREERLATIEKLGATIIHDLKSPLSAIKGYADILEDISNDERIKKYAKSIGNSVDFSFEMIEDILEFGRDRGSLDFRPIDIYQYLKEVVELFGKTSAGKEIEIVILPCENLFFELDPFKMKRVLLNLLKNAREAIKETGRIELGAEKTETGIKLFVRDNGIGMSPEIISRIFEPFFTHRKQGTGLGMTVVKKVIEEHSGKIKIESTPNKGTTFNILFENKTKEMKI